MENQDFDIWNNESGISLYQNGAEKPIKILKILFKYNFTTKLPKNAIIVMAMIFNDFPWFSMISKLENGIHHPKSMRMYARAFWNSWFHKVPLKIKQQISLEPKNGAYRGPIGQNKLGGFCFVLIFLMFFIVFLAFIFFLNG